MFKGLFSLSILDRYIIGKYVKTFLFTLILLSVVAVVFDLAERIEKFISKNIQLDNNGQLIWSKKIHKNQYTTNKNLALLLGYSFNIIDNKLYFIFNDNITNNNESDITLPASFAGEQACTSLAVVDKTGNINRTSILTYIDLNGAFIPRFSLVQSNNNLFLAVASLRKSVNQFTNIKEFYFTNYKIQ